MLNVTFEGSVPCPEDAPIEGGAVVIERVATLTCGHDAVVDIVGAVAAGAQQLLAVGRPGQGIVGAAVLLEAVGALAFVADEQVGVTAAADDDGIVGP